MSDSLSTSEFVRRGEGIDPVDRHVGSRIRLRRILLGLSQQELAARIGVAFQQLQKYELGKNRVSASMLWRLAKAIHVPVSFFFDDLDEGGSGNSGPEDVEVTRECLEVIRRWPRLHPDVRASNYRLIKALVGGADDETDDAED